MAKMARITSAAANWMRSGQQQFRPVPGGQFLGFRNAGRLGRGVKVGRR
jgi:hypothetical protein